MNDFKDFELRHEFSKKALKEIEKHINFETNTKFELPYKECQKNNFPYVTISTKGNWFTVKLSFDHCTYKLNDKATSRLRKDFDNSIGMIEGYRLANGKKVPRYNASGLGEIWIDFVPIHKKYFLKLIKRFLDYGVINQYHQEHK